MHNKRLHTLVLFFLILVGMSSMTTANNVVSKRALTLDKSIAIESFWQSVHQASFKTVDKIDIAYATNFNRPEKPYIIIVPGRTESYLKYQELMFDLDLAGYDSVIIDHRGQGLSQRLTSNRLQGHVEEFDHYAQDLKQLLSQVLPKKYPQHQLNAFMLAHSMGGAIALRYLQLYPNNIKALSLSSPMIAITSGGTPKWLAKSLINTGNMINHWLSGTPWYFFGQTDVNTSSFSENRLMHSAPRFERFQTLYQKHPELNLGGVTFNWLAQAMNTTDKLFNDLNKLSLPILLMQAGDEHIIDNIAQNNFCEQLNKFSASSCPENKPLIIPGAYHELLFELDKFRDIAIDHTLSWFSQHHSDH